MCEVMQKYEKIAADIAVNEERLLLIQNLIRMNCNKEFILKAGFTEDEYREAEKLISAAPKQTPQEIVLV